MPNDQVFSIEIKFTLEFKRNLRVLSRKYRHIRSDVQPEHSLIESYSELTRQEEDC